jgi:hypothetical protein
MAKARQEWTASTQAIAKSRFQISIKSLGAKNNYLIELGDSSNVFEFHRGTNHG